MSEYAIEIGRAISRNSCLFLFDEPLSNLDAALQVHTRFKLERLHDELKKTMVPATRLQASVRFWATNPDVETTSNPR